MLYLQKSQSWQIFTEESGLAMKKFILVYLSLIFATAVFSQSKKDTLFFNNGSIVIGEIKKIKLGVITFDPDDANDITVQLRKLKTVSAVSKIFRIETV